MNDPKFAFRQLLKNPGFTAVAVLTLALGIRATPAIFSVLDAVLLKLLPVQNSEQLVALNHAGGETGAATDSRIPYSSGCATGTNHSPIFLPFPPGPR